MKENIGRTFCDGKMKVTVTGIIGGYYIVTAEQGNMRYPTNMSVNEFNRRTQSGEFRECIFF